MRLVDTKLNPFVLPSNREGRKRSCFESARVWLVSSRRIKPEVGRIFCQIYQC